jgi:hypothetical protein
MTTPLPIVRAADLEDGGEDRQWLIETLWARSGVGILGGAPKCCKSWLGLDMALSVASGTPCLGALDVEDPGNVLIYMAEDAAAVVKARLLGLCRHRDLDLASLPIDVITAPVLRLDLERDQRRLAEATGRLRPRLLLLDPFVRLHRIDENNAGDVSALLAYLRGLERQEHVAIVVVHHARKNGPSGAQAGVGLRGSGDLHAWGDNNLYLRRSRDKLVLTVEHRAAAAPPPMTLALVGADGDTHLEIVGDASGCATADEPAPARDLETELLAALDAAGAPLSRSALRASLRVRNERLGEILSQLAADGRIARRGELWARAEPVPVVPFSREKSAERNGERTS